MPRQRAAVNRRRQKTTMNGLLGTFFLSDFDEFFKNYRSTNKLADEVLTALEQFLPALNEYFDLCEGLADVMNCKISWYSYTNAPPCGDYIRAKSMYYNESLFSDVSINMSEEETEDYNTDKGACFGKVHSVNNISSFILISMSNNNVFCVFRFSC